MGKIKYLLVPIILRQLSMIYHTVKIFIKIEYLRTKKYPTILNMPVCKISGDSIFELATIYIYYIPRLYAYILVYRLYGEFLGSCNSNKVYILIAICRLSIVYVTGIPYVVYQVLLTIYKNKHKYTKGYLFIYCRDKLINDYGVCYNSNSAIVLQNNFVILNQN